jgi:hypothetical protein
MTNVESEVFTLRLMMDEMVLKFWYYIGCKLCLVAMLVLDFLFWFIVESLQDITIDGALTFGVFV